MSAALTALATSLIKLGLNYGVLLKCARIGG